MIQSAEAPRVDLARIVEVLDRHGVDYLLVGGGAARLYGADRLTRDTDCLVGRSQENLERLAAAMRNLGARLRVEGLSDEEAAALPVRVDAAMLTSMAISTWATDAGWFDVLADIPALDGRRLRYEDLVDAAVTLQIGTTPVPTAPLEVIIASKEWANRPKDLQALPELRLLAESNLPPAPVPEP